jgi:uncharacterized protein (DUF2147 family)
MTLIRSSRLSLVVALGLLSPAAAQAPAHPVFGVWIDHTGRGAVELKPCGTAVCGQIVWLQQPNASNGRPLTDGNNPNAAMRNRPICGLQIIGDVQPTSDGSFADGWIYNPEDGGRFSLDLKLLHPDRLQIHGFAGMRFLGETHVWTRAAATQPRCKV